MMVRSSSAPHHSCAACGAEDWQVIGHTDGGPYLRCQSCGFHIQERSGSRTQDDRFEEEQANHYIHDPLCTSPQISQLRQKRFARWLKILRRRLPTGSVLEVGPGNGDMLQIAKDHGYAVEAVEHSRSLARAIRERVGVDVHIGAFEDQTIDSGAFDAFLSFHVIEHVSNVQAHLAKAAEVVRPGGYAFIATPNADSWEHKTPFGLSPNYSTAHLQLFSERSMRMFLEKTGWLLLEVHTPSYSEAWARVATSVFRRLRGNANSIQRGELLRGAQSHKLRWVMQAFGAVTFPIRWVQEELHWGNELIIVAKRRDP